MASEIRDENGVMGYSCISRIITETTQTIQGLVIWYRGAVLTPDGIVNVLYSEPTHTRMEFVHGGRLHSRNWRKQFQPRYLVALARKFAAEKAQEADDGDA